MVTGVLHAADRIGYRMFAFIKDPIISNYPASCNIDLCHQGIVSLLGSGQASKESQEDLNSVSSHLPRLWLCEGLPVTYRRVGRSAR